MKYWLLENGDAHGPYDAEELKRLPGFSPDSIIAPDGATSAEQWKPAQFYLIRPPTAKPPSDGPGAKAGRMGRIAEVEQEQARVEAPAPSVIPRAEPRPGLRLSPAALACAVAALAAASAGIWLMKKPAKGPEPAPAAVAAPAAAPQAPDLPAVDPGLQREAIEFAKAFPVDPASEALPLEAADVLEPARWRAPKTLAAALERRPLVELALETAKEARKRGKTSAQARREIARDRAGWGVRADRWLKRNGLLRWEADLLSGSRWRVSAVVERRDLPTETLGFEADLLSRTLKPLDAEAWHAVNGPAYAKWADRNVPLGETPAASEVAAAAPRYELERPQPRRAAKRPLNRKVALAQAQAEAAAAKAAKPDGPADDIGDVDLGDLEPAEKVAEKPAPPSEPPPEQRPPHSEPRMELPKPQPRPVVAAKPSESGPRIKDTDQKDMLERALAEAEGKPSAKKAEKKPDPAAQLDDDEPKKKNAMDMSVDELSTYLGTGGDRRFQ